MSKLIFILQDAFHVARNIAFATVKSLTDIGNSSNTILFFINCVHYPPQKTLNTPLFLKFSSFSTTRFGYNIMFVNQDKTTRSHINVLHQTGLYLQTDNTIITVSLSETTGSHRNVLHRTRLYLQTDSTINTVSLSETMLHE